MRSIWLILFNVSFWSVLAQNPAFQSFKNDTLLIVEKNPEKGFFHEYLLYVPVGTPINKEMYLLVEPNNTGKTSDSIEVHKMAAINLATLSSVGNNVSRMLKIPLLVPIFPRPAAQELTYTHALDRDVMLEDSPSLKRLDLQLLAMIADARRILESMGIMVETKFFMDGFSASATFTNRFSLIHPQTIQALAIGGFNGELMLPQKDINGIALKYPLGIQDFSEIFKIKFDMDSFRKIPQYIYLGSLDDNDAVQFDDAYSEEERQIINHHIGKNVQERFLACQQLYHKSEVFPIFKTYEGVGHWTTSDMSLDIINFFFQQMK